jgi:hypothetical protein
MKTKTFVLIIIAVIAIWGLSFISLFFFKDWSERGQFGDLFERRGSGLSISQ